MKKVLTILAISLGLGTAVSAQSDTKFFYQPGVSVQNKVFTQEFKMGLQFDNKHQFAVTGETYNVNNQNGNRQYWAGLEYGRMFEGGGKNSVVALAAGKIQLNSKTYNVLVEPGIGYNMYVSENFSIQPSVSTQFGEGSTIGKNVPLKAGIGLQVSL